MTPSPIRTAEAMSAIIVKLASCREKPAIRSCESCLHRIKSWNGCRVTFYTCASERHYDHPRSCGPEGRFWEALPLPPRHPGLFERCWRFLAGGGER